MSFYINKDGLFSVGYNIVFVDLSAIDVEEIAYDKTDYECSDPDKGICYSVESWVYYQ